MRGHAFDPPVAQPVAGTEYELQVSAAELVGEGCQATVSLWNGAVRHKDRVRLDSDVARERFVKAVLERVSPHPTPPPPPEGDGAAPAGPPDGLRAALRAALLGPDYDDHGLVFCTHDGAPLIYRNVTRAFKRLVARAGLPATTRLYDLRHANATAMLKAGVHPKSAAERLGPSGTTLFMDTYAHMLEELDADAAARLGRAIRGPGRADRAVSGEGEGGGPGGA